MASTPTSLIDRAGLDRPRLAKIISRGLEGADDGELFLEYRQAEMLVFDNGRLKQATYDTSQGFGLRAVKDEAVGYAHASDVSEAAIARAADAVRAVKGGYSGRLRRASAAHQCQALWRGQPARQPQLRNQGAATGNDRRLCPRQGPARAPSHGQPRRDLAGRRNSARRWRDLSRRAAAGARQRLGRGRRGDRQETGSAGYGGREGYERFLLTDAWQGAADNAVRQALINLKSVPAPAGEMDVVLGPGWPGVMLHEAVGHGLEGDFNRKKTSAFAGLMGQQVAAKGVTVVDDGTMALRRGSLSIDDEGTPTSRTVLIEDGILVGYMQDRQNARLMRMKPTGNGRRESFAHVPMPRMTNTYMLAGDREPGEIIASVKDGIYAVHFGGGQVDITSGKYVFQCTEAYRIENGKVGAPIKGAMLIGNGPTDLHRVSMVGNDLALDNGIGTCGKNGQGVPVGVGQPTLRIDRITVGGTG